ncbi:MAG TPA: hypothetical protein VF135_04935 [Terriglobales bacterium]
MNRRRIPGLRTAVGSNNDDVPEGLYLVRVNRLQYRYDRQKPYFTVRLVVIEPEQYANNSLRGRLYCTPKALWKLSWFLRDFGYDQELLGREEIDERAVIDLTGIVNVSHSTINGRIFLNLEGFAPSSQWKELSSVTGKEAA